MIGRRRFITLTAAAAILPGVAQARVAWQGVALGADARITLTGDQVRAEAALAELPALLDRVENLFSLYRPSSALTRLNNTGRLMGADPDFAALMQLSSMVHTATDGAFDPSIGGRIAAMLAGRDPAGVPVNWSQVGQAPPSLPPGMQLTFNGIAQGFATDAARALLAAHGFTHALIEMGETQALGGPYRIGIVDPDQGLLGTTTLLNTALATSSPRATLIAGQPHILHPMGLPPLWTTITIKADSAALADALSTALVFLPDDRIAALNFPGLQAVWGVDGTGLLRLR